MAIDNDGILGGLHSALELAVHGVILQHIGQIVSGAQVIDAHDLNFGMVDAGTEDHTADPAKAVNTNFDRHGYFPPFQSRRQSGAFHIVWSIGPRQHYYTRSVSGCKVPFFTNSQVYNEICWTIFPLPQHLWFFMRIE